MNSEKRGSRVANRSIRDKLSAISNRISENLRSSVSYSGYGLALGFFICMTALAWHLHDSFRTHALDLGYFDQILWNTAHGRPFANTLKYPYNFLGDHFSPILAFLAPLYWVWDDVHILLASQALALALAGLPLYFLALPKCQAPGEWWFAPLVLLAFYLNPELHLTALRDFHEIALATPFISLALYGLCRGRYRLMAFGLFLGLLCKEDVAITVMAFGVYLLLVRERKWGAGILALGAAWLAGAIFLAIPYFRGGEYGSIEARYSYLGSTPQEALQTILRDPLILARHLLQWKKLMAFLRFLFPMAFLPFLGWQLLLLGLPLCIYLQLSDDPGLYTLWEWHVAPLIPIFFAATILALGRFSRARQRRWRKAAAGAVLAASLLSFALYSPAWEALSQSGMPPQKARQAQAILARIPQEAVVSAQSDILPHLSHREEIYLFPSVIDRADYIVLDMEGNPYPVPDTYPEIVSREVLPNPHYRVLYNKDGLLLLERAEPPLAASPLAVFGREIALRGWSLAVEGEDGFFYHRCDALQKYIAPGEPNLEPGDVIELSLYWEALSRQKVDYTVFVHFVDPASGRMSGQHDGMPADAACPTTSWRPGELVKDTHYIRLEGKSGKGEVRVGLYELGTGERLPVEKGETWYTLTKFTINRTLMNTDFH